MTIDVQFPMAQLTGPGQDAERFVRLFLDGQREILRYILALLPGIDDAQEILQETTVDLWQKFDRYDPAIPFTPWACRYLSTLKRSEVDAGLLHPVRPTVKQQDVERSLLPAHVTVHVATKASRNPTLRVVLT
jgi:DNA-directed RNA polymerase specialized sigma24 family protein